VFLERALAIMFGWRFKAETSTVFDYVVPKEHFQEWWTEEKFYLMCLDSCSLRPLCPQISIYGAGSLQRVR